jgi:hypothetical protein
LIWRIALSDACGCTKYSSGGFCPVRALLYP